MLRGCYTTQNIKTVSRKRLRVIKKKNDDDDNILIKDHAALAIVIPYAKLYIIK